MHVEPGWIGAGFTGASFVGGLAAIGFRTLTRVTVLERRVEVCECDLSDGDRRLREVVASNGLLTGKVEAHEGRLDRIQQDIRDIRESINDKGAGRRGH